MSKKTAAVSVALADALYAGVGKKVDTTLRVTPQHSAQIIHSETVIANEVKQSPPCRITVSYGQEGIKCGIGRRVVEDTTGLPPIS